MKKFVEMSYRPIYGLNVHDLLITPDSKSLVSHLGLGTFKSRSCLDFLLQVPVSWCQSLVLVSKILAKTPALPGIILQTSHTEVDANTEKI